MALLVLFMVAVGGITRLTGSGLSIVEWKPISGTLPPLSEAEWQADFEAYQQIPQYQYVNKGMSLAEFKFIFFWEWFHRFLGRIIGLAFAVPFVVFLFQRRFSWDLAAPLAGLFVLGGFQGVLGWWMVSSGLSELTSVSQYRLAAHLGAAALLFMALVWVARRLEPTPMTPERPRWPITVLLLLVFLQLIAGAFVAGMDAGMGYNTWPLMDGALIPSGLDAMSPGWKNLFENALTVQFLHRCLAYVIVLYAGFLLWRQARRGEFAGANGWLPRISLLIVLQVALGVATLLTFVPISLAVGHQALAFLLCGAIVAYLADMTGKTAR
ncbi:MAG: heme A synthase [Hyphomicrobiales bacterium]|nr:MAG: heme A synthase [Hyphomicrobiales bacterium]